MKKVNITTSKDLKNNKTVLRLKHHKISSLMGNAEDETNLSGTGTINSDRESLKYIKSNVRKTSGKDNPNNEINLSEKDGIFSSNLYIGNYLQDNKIPGFNYVPGKINYFPKSHEKNKNSLDKIDLNTGLTGYNLNKSRIINSKAKDKEEDNFDNVSNIIDLDKKSKKNKKEGKYNNIKSEKNKKSSKISKSTNSKKNLKIIKEEIISGKDQTDNNIPIINILIDNQDKIKINKINNHDKKGYKENINIFGNHPDIFSHTIKTGNIKEIKKVSLSFRDKTMKDFVENLEKNELDFNNENNKNYDNKDMNNQNLDGKKKFYIDYK